MPTMNIFSSIQIAASGLTLETKLIRASVPDLSETARFITDGQRPRLCSAALFDATT